MYKQLKVTLRNTLTAHTKELFFNIREHNLAQKWARALDEDYLHGNSKLEKQFLLHGWNYPQTPAARTVRFLCNELNYHIAKVNAYAMANDIDYYVDLHFTEEALNQELLNKIHHHFEVLIGQVWNESEYYSKFDKLHQFSINNFNWICHELESMLKGIEANSQGRAGSSMVICMYPIIRHEMSEEAGDYDHFQMKDLEFGQVRMHYAQTGKTHREAWHDNDSDIFDNNITGIRYISGEFDVHLNVSTLSDEQRAQRWADFTQWLIEKGVDVTDKTLSLGWCVLADLDRSNWQNMSDIEIIRELWTCDDFYAISLIDDNGVQVAHKEYDYTWVDWYNDKKSGL